MGDISVCTVSTTEYKIYIPVTVLWIKLSLLFLYEQANEYSVI